MSEREWICYLDDMIGFAESSGMPALFPLPWFHVRLPAVEKFGILAWREVE